MKIVIIAGGQGTRIASVNGEIPKAMIPICGKPILEYEIEIAKRYGYREFLFIVGHMGDQITAYFGNGDRWGVSIEYFYEKTPLGTAGALAYLKAKLTEDFFVFYGDTIFDVDLQRMVLFHCENNADATLFVHPNDHPYDSDLVDMDTDNRVRNFFIKPHPDHLISRNIVNASLFVFSPTVLNYIPVGEKCHIEKNVLPICLTAGLKVFGYKSFEYIKDMGTPDRYYSVTDDVKSGKVLRLNLKYPRKAIFLDRDGTISEEVKFLCKPEQLHLIPGAAEAIRMINHSEYLAIVVTNQPVIARNMCTIEELDYIHAKLETLLGAEHAFLNEIYYCPHHPDKGYPEERPEYKIECNCRKPKPGLLLRAAKDWNINLAESIMIGDSDRDVQAGENAGCKVSVKIGTNEPNALLNMVKKIL